MEVTDVFIDGIHYQYGDECEDGICVWLVSADNSTREQREYCTKHTEAIIDEGAETYRDDNGIPEGQTS